MTQNTETISPLLKTSRVIGLVAAILTIVLYGVMVFFNPYNGHERTIENYRVVIMMCMLALLAIWGSLKFKPLLLLIAFFCSFFPVGLYLLGTHGIFALIGICNLLFLVTGIVMFIFKKKQRKHL